MSYTYPAIVVYADKAGLWRWRWIARNGRNVANSGESFSSRRSAKRAALALCNQLLTAHLIELVVDGEA